MFVRDRHTWFSYWMIAYFAFLQAALGPLMPFLRGALHLTYTVASLHFSAFALGSTVVGGLSDRLVQRWGGSYAVWGGALGMAGGAVVVVFAPTPRLTVPGAFIMGACGVLVLISVQASIVQRHGASSAVAMAEANVTASVLAFLAPITIGFAALTVAGWRVALLLPIALLAVLASLSRSTQPYAFHARPEGQSSSDGPSMPLPFSYWILWGALALETAVEWSVAYWGTSLLVASGGASAAQAASTLSVFFLAMVAGRFLGSRVLRVYPGERVFVVALCVGLIGLPLFWLGPAFAWRAVGLFIVGLGLANVYPVGVTLAARVFPAAADRAIARLAIGTGLSVLVAPIILGRLADNVGIQTAFVVTIPLLLASLALALMRGRRQSEVNTRVETSEPV